MKPNLKFLQNVADRKVFSTQGYSARGGAVFGFVGGKKTYERHLEEGFVHPARGGGLWVNGYVTLTEKGKRTLLGEDYE